MKKVGSLLLFLVVALSCSKDPGPETGGTFEGSAVFSTQEALDEFTARQYETIRGVLVIEGMGNDDEGSPITDLSGLSSLTRELQP